MFKNTIKLHSKVLLLIIIIAGSILRITNLGNNDLWFDEILTFSIASDKISFKEFWHLSNSLDGTPILFNFFFRTIFQYLPYDVIYAKFLLSIFSIFSILLITYLSFTIDKEKKSYLLTAFFVSFNVLLVDYCSELRIYSFIFFTSTLSIIFFFKFYNYQNNFNFSFFCLFTVINSFLHPLTLVIFFSYVFFLILNFFKKKFLQKKIITAILLIMILNLIYYYFYFIFSDIYKMETWIQNVRIDFFYNYFFSNFFGSRILGVFFFCYSIYLVLKNISFFKNDIYLFLLILVLFSYILPLTFSYLIKPILIPRYIIFVLIPIILLISNLTLNLKNLLLKSKFVFFIIFVVLINMPLEAPIKKIYENNYNKKPDFTKALNLISISDYRDFSITYSHDLLLKKKEDILRIYELYLHSLVKKKYFKINYVREELITSRPGKLWLLCDYAINLNNCKISNEKNFKILKNIDLFKINLKLIEVI